MKVKYKQKVRASVRTALYLENLGARGRDLGRIKPGALIRLNHLLRSLIQTNETKKLSGTQ